MKVILGLGNPGKQYERTRHNVGWWVLDRLADIWHFGSWKAEGQALVASGLVGAAKVKLVKPQTFMNLSGAALATHLKRPFWSPKTDLLVIVDDVALPVGTFRLRAQGSAGGHNGLKSVEQHVGHREYARLRIGIEPADPERRIGDLADYVLSPFGKAEREEILALMPRFTDAAELWLREGIVKAMNAHNTNAHNGT
jgi:peptidyl-tRNA hydrolase, PTH1 family